MTITQVLACIASFFGDVCFGHTKKINEVFALKYILRKGSQLLGRRDDDISNKPEYAKYEELS